MNPDYDTNQQAVDRHRAVITGLRQLADHLDTIEPLPLPAYEHVALISISMDTGWQNANAEEKIARLRTWATRLGVEPWIREDDHGLTYWRADRSFGRVQFGVSCVTETAVTS